MCIGEEKEEEEKKEVDGGGRGNIGCPGARRESRCGERILQYKYAGQEDERRGKDRRG